MFSVNRLKIISIGIIVFLVMVFFFLVSFLPKPTTNTVSPKPTIISNEKIPQSNIFKIESFTPKNQTSSYYPDQPIEIVFNQNVSKEGVKIEIVPLTNYYFTQGDEKNKLILYPKTFWKMGETKITFLTNSVSYNGLHLSSDFIYIIHAAIPTTPPLEGAY